MMTQGRWASTVIGKRPSKAAGLQRLRGGGVLGNAAYLVGGAYFVTVCVPQPLLNQIDGDVGNVDPDPAAFGAHGRVDRRTAAAERSSTTSLLLAARMRSISASGFCVG